MSIDLKPSVVVAVLDALGENRLQKCRFAYDKTNKVDRKTFIINN